MTHQIIETLVSFMGLIGFVVFTVAFLIIAIDVIDVYLRFREHIRNGDLAKRKDGK
jgi:hypothetical protein